MASARKYRPHIKHGGYLDKYLLPGALKESVALAAQALDGWRDEFQAIAYRGMSGALLAPAVAVAMDKTLIMVRKPDDGSHSLGGYKDTLSEGDAGATAYVIIDDFISSGATVRAIREAVKKFAPNAVCLGTLACNSLYEELLDRHRGEKYPLSQVH